jgi:hypothetical protein
MRKLCTIQFIKDLVAIPQADNIQKATILGWEVVVKKGEFKVTDPCVFCEIDSIMPDLPEFEFLRQSKFRIRTIRLRGQVSQGIAFPLSILHGKYKERRRLRCNRIIGCKEVGAVSGTGKRAKTKSKVCIPQLVPYSHSQIPC